ncbi:MAG: TIGR00730 family Rossman fold protein [Spirochaetota bacterium]
MTDHIKTLCVFCGSSMGTDALYAEGAEAFASALCEEGIDLVYGGSNVGLMGVIARKMLDGNRKVTGVIPVSLRKQVEHLEVSQLIVVESMHERKATMYGLADAFTALPGGIGTFEELLEVYTWSQLGYLSKPVSLLNIGSYFDPLIQQLHHSAAAGFIKQEHLESLLVSSRPRELLSLIRTSTYEYKAKWE